LAVQFVGFSSLRHASFLFLSRKVQDGGKALFKVLMDAWALAFTVNLNPMVAQSAAQA